ncbi:polysaccharide deacetylase family protein [Sulfitobacter sp. PS-8MA]|uniref:polysaccharide deacetylase family protein n=1 Tax=Sulfitobacter sp. PS-8MA TaxID=3237707 RepID=UPI0034C675F4
MATWAELDEEIGKWSAQGEVPTFWWRDDDTEACTDPLERLIALSERFRAPLHLAVIPAAIDDTLADRLSASPQVYTLQHGFAHKNHEPKGTRASEVGRLRDLALIEEDLREGWRRMQLARLPNMLPVFVPPWNRIGEKVLPYLPRWGYAALSGFDARPHPEPVPGLQHLNGHIDPIRWKEGAKFAGVEKTLEQCLRHLRKRRLEDAYRNEPTGLVSHHLQTDAETWDFMEALMARLTHRAATRWISLKSQMK